jgi:hypothetical protein
MGWRLSPRTLFFRKNKEACFCLFEQNTHPPFSRFGPIKDPNLVSTTLDLKHWFHLMKPHEKRRGVSATRNYQTDKVLAKIQDSNGTPKKLLAIFTRTGHGRTLPYEWLWPLGSARTLSSTSQKNFRCRFSSSLWTVSGWPDPPHGEPQHLVLWKQPGWTKMAKRVKT